MEPLARSEYIENCVLFYERFSQGLAAEDIARLVSAELKREGVSAKVETVVNPVTDFIKGFS